MVVNVGRSSRPDFKFAQSLALLFLCFSFASKASADPLFEGYSKVLLDGQHVGYVVQRYEFDNKKQEFTTAYYLKTNKTAGDITESLKARSNASLRPLSFQFTELVGDHAKTIDGDFKGDVMTAMVNDGGKKQTITKKIPKGAFLSSFLAYVMLQGKEGIKKGVKYSYQAIAEEDASLSSGEAFISGEETMDGISAFKVLNTFKGAQFVSYCTYKGEVIATRSPVQKVSTELVADVREATEGLTLNSSAMAHLFGAVPRGADNPVSRRKPEAAGGKAADKKTEKPEKAPEKITDKTSEDKAPAPPADEKPPSTGH